MYCFHDSINNQRGDALPGYFVECVNASGTVQTIYGDNGSTPIVSTSGVANRAKVDANGNVFFYVADGTYYTKIYDTTGAFVFTQGPYSMVGMDSVLASATSAASAATSASSAASSAATAAAYTDAKSANTAALIAAIRTNGFFPKPAWRTPAANVATITVPSGGAVSVITGGAATSANVPVTNTAKITWLAGTADKDVNATYFSRGSWYAGGRSWNYNSYEFTHTGTEFEAQIQCSNLSGGTYNFRVLVDDCIAGTAFITGDGSNRLIHVSFPSSATRRVRLEFAGGKMRGVNVLSTSEVASTGRTYPLVTVIGDSFPEATGSSVYMDGEGISTIRALGMNCALGATGGTGILNPGTGGKVNWQDSNRLSDLALNGHTDQITSAAPSPVMAVVMMSINDGALNDTYWGGAATYQDAVKKGLWAMIDHWQTQRAGKPLVVFGPTAPNGAPTLDVYRLRDAGFEAVMGLGGAANNLWFIDRLAPTPVLRTGSLSRSTLTGTLTSGSKVITGISSTSGLSAYSSISGTGIPDGARVLSIDSGTQVTIDINATASGAQSLTFMGDHTAHYTTTSDTTHPNQRGHNLDSLWMADKLRSLILTEFA